MPCGTAYQPVGRYGRAVERDWAAHSAAASHNSVHDAVTHYRTFYFSVLLIVLLFAFRGQLLLILHNSRMRLFLVKAMHYIDYNTLY